MKECGDSWRVPVSLTHTPLLCHLFTLVSFSLSATMRGIDWTCALSSFIMAVVLALAFFALITIITDCDLAHGHHGAG